MSIVEPARSERPGGYAEVWRVAYPLILSMGSLTIMQFCDRMFLSWYSRVAIQAALPASILSFTMLCGFMAVANYSSTFVAQSYGAGDHAGCGRATSQAIFIALVSWPLILLLMPAGWGILRVVGHDPEVQAAERAYFTIVMAGCLPTLVASALSGFFSGRGDTRTTMWAYMAGNSLNIVLDYALIFGKWGFPEMGIRGAAWATVISGVVSPVIFLVLFFSPRHNRVYATRASFRPDRVLLKRMVRFGLPSGVHLALDLTSFTLFVLLTGRLGDVVFAASNLALSINTLAFMPMIGMGVAAGVLVGQYQGRGQPDVAERAGWNALRMGAAYMAVIGLTYVLFPSFYLGLFTDHRGGQSFTLAEVLPTARVLLVMLAVWGMADACDLVLAGALKGAGDTRFVMYYSLALAWGMLVTGQVVLLLVLHAGIYASWAWTCSYIIVMAVGYLYRFRKGRWKTIDLLGKRETVLPPARPGADGMMAVE